ncbi:CASP8 and FADD-like apoptosis regulator isoform X2 [Syngnathoides biaculeatus]|uniref:CASP8 and FADD-like apoptosis regulator isoform X2 n=1 Tax=Syngnathoides biaculeatus TaxID=300417 RepID=UPI002ADE774A|nr:CASP8 and FADD-like apoptosis regulator isoform X2 [Syngnathoides biaculeatus]
MFNRPNQRFEPLPASMAVPDKELLRAIHQISESLGSNERSKILYLCGTSDTDNTAGHIKETLKSKVFGFSRDDVERALRSEQVLPRFRVLMAHISEDMAHEDVSSVKFLLGPMLPREKMETAKDFLDLIVELEHVGKVSPTSVDLLEECLMDVGRVDLAKKLKVYKMSVNTPAVPEELVQVVRHACQETPVSRYKFASDPRGECVIIDCVGHDGEMMAQIFKSLHFNVTLHKWLNLVETVSTLRQVFRRSPDRSGDGFVCCIISRATDNRLQATDTNCEGLRLEDVRRFFNGDACPVLVGKPKLFFVQSYAVSEFQPCAVVNRWDDGLESDGGGGQLRPDCLPADADVLWSHCSTGEDQLQRGRHRSVYLKALTDALGRNQGRSRHLVELHLEVNGAIFEHNSRHPEEQYHIDLKHTLRKDLYL